MVTMARIFAIIWTGALVCSLNTQENRGAFDLNGVWEASFGAPGTAEYRVEKILVYHLRNSIQAYNIEGRRFIRPGARFLTAAYPLPASLPLRISADIHSLPGGDTGKLQWLSTTMSIDDRNHFRIADIQEFHRTSTRKIQDVSCETANPHHIRGEDAFFRSNAYFELKDLATANCWLRIGSIEGYALAQSAYSYALLHGRGIRQNTDEAMVWAKKSADQHEAYGESMLAAIYLQMGFGLGVGQAQELMKRYKQHDPDVPYVEDHSRKEQPADATAERSPTMPVFLRDETFTYDLSGEWRLVFPPKAPRHPLFSITVIQKDGNFQMIVGDPNVLYPIGESMFNGRYADNRITGQLMDAPAHHGNGYRGYAWTDAEIRIVDANNLVLPGDVKMKRTDGELGANKICDAVKYAGLDASRVFIYAEKDIELKNSGNGACWLYVSASQGHSEAQMDLGLALHFGEGVKRDYEQSFLWFKKSAEQGWVLAERALARCYESGIGVPKDAALARSWNEKSNRPGAQMGQVEREEQDANRFISAFGNLLSGNGVSREDRVAGYRSRGMNNSDAEKNAREDEAGAAFMHELMNGYQPPPMPPQAVAAQSAHGNAGATQSAPVASRGEKVDLNGFWSTPPFVNNFGQKITMGMKIVQNRDNVTVTLNQAGQPKMVLYEGHFDGATLITGRSRGPSSSPDNPNWGPETITVVDGRHLKFSTGGQMVERIGGLEDARLEQGTPYVQPKQPYLPEKPFDLNGNWRAEVDTRSLFPAHITQKDGEVTMAFAGSSGPSFSGRYIQNPSIPGKALSKKVGPPVVRKDGTTSYGQVWVDGNIFVEDPDHIRLNSEDHSIAYYRFSEPSRHDLACDAQNSFHVQRLPAWMRGKQAASEQDYKAARCWLTIGADQGSAPAQSLLAALLIEGRGSAAPDYQSAFALASKSAQQGDIAGQLELASLYREGKGTPQDAGKAQYWADRAKQSKSAAEWKLWNTKLPFGLSPLDIAGAALGLAVATDQGIENGCSPSVTTCKH